MSMKNRFEAHPSSANIEKIAGLAGYYLRNEDITSRSKISKQTKISDHNFDKYLLVERVEVPGEGSRYFVFLSRFNKNNEGPGHVKALQFLDKRKGSNEIESVNAGESGATTTENGEMNGFMTDSFTNQLLSEIRVDFASSVLPE